MKDPKRPYWITRDLCPLSGDLDDVVEVWSARPAYYYGVWCHPLVDTVRLARITLATAQRLFPTLPETSLECICYGEAPT